VPASLTRSFPTRRASDLYDPATDFTAISMMWAAPHLLVVHPSVPAKNLAEFIAYARANKLSYGSSGVGSSTHLFGEMFKRATGRSEEQTSELQSRENLVC